MDITPGNTHPTSGSAQFFSPTMQPQVSRQALVEKRLLFCRPRRRRWPRKTPALVRVTNTPGGPMKIMPQNLFTRQNTTQSKIRSALSSILDHVQSSLANISATTLLGYYITVLLYNPYGPAAKLAKNAFCLILNLPPFFTSVIFPLVTVYLVNRFIQFVLQEYQSFLDLGRGGTPSTPMGLVKVSLKKICARVDVLEPPHIDPMLEPYRGILFGLEQREGVRPIIKGVAPQRQFDQKTPVSTFHRLLQMLKDAASKDSSLKVTTSYLEGHTEALKAKFEDRDHEVLGTDGEWDYEIAHPHKVDGSMHMILHPEDIRIVIENGWGEKHPLATNAWYWKFYYHNLRCKRRPVPYNLVLCYAPRAEKEFLVMRKILDAAIWFHKERAVCEKVASGALARLDDGSTISRKEALSRGYVVGKGNRLIALDKAIERRWYKLVDNGKRAQSLLEPDTLIEVNSIGNTQCPD